MELILRIVRRLVPKAHAILDLGCGDGILGRMLLTEYPQARCVFLDFSQPMLDLAGKVVSKDGQKHRSRLVLADLGGARLDECGEELTSVRVGGVRAVHPSSA